MKTPIEAGRDPAIVVGGNLNGLGVVRSLAAAGIPSYTIDTSLSFPAMWSRFTTPVVSESLEGRAFVDALISFAAGLPSKPALILTYEAAVDAVADHFEEVSAFCRISFPDREMVRTLADKSRFNVFAQENGLPIPAGVSVASINEIGALEGIPAPYVVKPLRPHDFEDFPRAMRCETREGAQLACVRFLERGLPVIVQEWVEGADAEIYFSLFYANVEHEIVAQFEGRKLASYPPSIGSTSACAPTIEHADEIRAIVANFVRCARYRGLGGLELKRDTRSGRFMIIEPTVGRTDMQSEIATLAGVNLPAIACRYEMGLPVERAPRVDPDVAWRVSMVHGLRSRVDLPGAKIFDGYLRADDPGPALFYYLGRLPSETARRIARR